jgi:DNA-binding GntR family transcriptional regulator
MMRRCLTFLHWRYLFALVTYTTLRLVLVESWNRLLMSKSSPRADVAYQALRRAIIEQALAPGAKLPEHQIGIHFCMSRTLVRATFGRLQSEGLVDCRARRTVTVARPSIDEAREIFEVRKALEREAVALIIRRWNPEYGGKLEGHVREENAAKERRDDKLSIRLAGEFHIKLAAMSGNCVLERYLGELVSRCSLILALYGRPHSSECAVSEHSEIIAALRRGDAGQAVQLMDERVGSVEQRALLAGAPDGCPSLGAVLSQYATSTEARKSAAPLQFGKPRAAQ